jgi:hypothetical protein
MNKLVFRLLGAALVFTSAEVSVAGNVFYVSTSNSSQSYKIEYYQSIYLKNKDGLDHVLNISYSTGSSTKIETITLGKGESYDFLFGVGLDSVSVSCTSHGHKVAKIYT